jgi:hypothetical protein
MGGILGGPYDTIVAANVTAMDAVRGVASLYKDIDSGLILFYIIAGDVYYRQYIDGVWGDQETVSLAPSNCVKIRAERVLDWRIVLQITDNAGSLYEVFSKMQASGWNSFEMIQLTDISITTAVLYEVSYSDYQSPDENLELTTIQIGENWLMADYSPYIVNVENRPIEMDLYGYDDYTYDNWGYLVKFTFDQVVRNAEDYPEDFIMTDALGVVWHGQEAYKPDEKSRDVYVLFINFNNATNPIEAKALAGNLWNGYVDLTETSFSFNAVNLVPYETDPPVILSIENIVDWSEE